MQLDSRKLYHLSSDVRIHLEAVIAFLRAPLHRAHVSISKVWLHEEASSVEI